ncbi:MAG: HAD family hydrolase, partial [Acidobacteria bacterium]|nr:HAD family hydrolase [Acidobacteriota bacterium]
MLGPPARAPTAGVLIRNAEALETLERVDTLIVDKTGTLTTGNPAVRTVVALGGRDEGEMVGLAAGLERASEHPLAAAIVAEAVRRGLAIPPADDFQSETGRGVRGTVGGRQVAVGTAAFLEQMGMATTPAAAPAAELAARGETVVHVALDGAPAGLIGITDPVKPTTPEAIRRQEAGRRRSRMVAGDGPPAAEGGGPA